MIYHTGESNRTCGALPVFMPAAPSRRSRAVRRAERASKTPTRDHRPPSKAGRRHAQQESSPPLPYDWTHQKKPTIFRATSVVCLGGGFPRRGDGAIARWMAAGPAAQPDRRHGARSGGLVHLPPTHWGGADPRVLSRATGRLLLNAPAFTHQALIRPSTVPASGGSASEASLLAPELAGEGRSMAQGAGPMDVLVRLPVLLGRAVLEAWTCQGDRRRPAGGPRRPRR